MFAAIMGLASALLEKPPLLLGIILPMPVEGHNTWRRITGARSAVKPS